MNESIQHQGLRCLIFLALLVVSAACRPDELLEVTIIDPYVDMHSGPGRGFPVTHVVENGEPATLLKQRTDWIKISTLRNKTGWVHRDDLQLTLGRDNQLIELARAGIGDYMNRRWSAGFAAGDFGGANSLAAHLGYRFSNNLSLEGRIMQAVGEFSDSRVLGAAIIHETWPEWRISPFFSLGVAAIKTSPDATLVQVQDRSDVMMTVGLGAQSYLSRRFILRLEYNNNVILTNRESNQEVDEWKFGFNVFF